MHQKTFLHICKASDGADGSRDSVTLPPGLTNTQRKFVHKLLKRLGLKSKSHIKGEDRKVVVRKGDRVLGNIAIQ